MERRKVQLTGSSTFTISLPKEWAVEQGIEPGQRLALRPGESGALIVGVEQAGGREAVALPIDGRDPEAAVRTLRAAYVCGFDGFELRVRPGTGPDGGDEPSAAVRRAVREAAGRLVGVEIDREDGRTIAFRDLLAADELSTARLVSKLQFTALSTHRDAATALRTGDGALVEGAERRRRDVRAELAAVERRFRRALLDFDGSDRTALFGYVAAAERLDRVADEAVRLADLVDRRDGHTDGGMAAEPEWSASWTDAVRRSHDLVEDGVDAVLSGATLEEARSIRARYDDCRDAIDGLDAEVGGDRGQEPPVRAVCSLRRVADAGREIADRAVQTAVRNGSAVGGSDGDPDADA